MDLEELKEQFVVCRWAGGQKIELPEMSGSFYSLSVSKDEWSLVCATENLTSFSAPPQKIQGNFKALKVCGTLEFDLVGILAGLAIPLAEAEISIFAISTYDTDYILVGDKDMPRAREVLTSCRYNLRK